MIFYFNNMSYVDITKIQGRYLNTDTKYQLRFYDSMIEKISIYFPNYYDLTTFLCKLQMLVDKQTRDIYDTNYLYVSTPDEYGNLLEVCANYTPITPDVPTDEDDYINLYIFKINELYHYFSTIYSITIPLIIIEDFIEFIFNILQYDHSDIIQIAEGIFINLSYGDFIQ